uniref:Uncharacterized protein n=1 Tax=Sander lucioperca TaxID=283035 RepID=A0A8D0ALD1_SANLU
MTILHFHSNSSSIFFIRFYYTIPPMTKADKFAKLEVSLMTDCSHHCLGDYCHRRFRWAAVTPSTLLQKFRNYEI